MTTAEDPATVPRLSLPAWLRATDDTRRDGPIVIEGAVAEPVRGWSPEELARSFGDVDVSVRRKRPGSRRIHVERATLADFVAAMDPDTLFSAPQIPPGRLPGVTDRLDLGRLFVSRAAWAQATDHVRLTVGDGVRVRLHWEPVDMFLVQVHGATRIVAEPPGSTADRYPSPVWPTASLADVDDPQHDTRFPVHTGEGRVRTVLEPGDVLHLPRGWWYDTCALGRIVWATIAHGPALPLPAAVHDRLVALSEKGT